jgi:hypothetical protein
MELNQYVLLGYAIFLILMLLINLLYFFQIYKYRLPGDASLPVLTLHIVLILTVISLTTIFVRGLG